ncbi:MAG TPA: MetQ/NlpA family ABC transporter substrate-binding protein [Bacillota bacterium]|nr:MetQ/NlpA family ABC transporter substrate-binding protein [Bacillota bacterium]
MKRLLLLIVSALFIFGTLTACGKEEESKELSEEKIVVGVTGGPHEQIFEIVKDLAAEDGLEIELKVFSDYVMPNTALAEGEIDLNSYQHKPFMDKFNEDHETDLAAVFPTVLSAIGVYSNEITDINDTPQDAKIGIPNDPTNGARALILFEEAGIIELDDDKRETATPVDVVTNERNVEFIELDAAQIPLMLDEVDLAVINGNFATANGLDPTTDSIFTEDTDSPYVNYLVSREENKDDPVIEIIKKAYFSDEVKDFIMEEFKGAYQPSW